MTTSEHLQAILLLTAHFRKAEAGAVKPLAPKEWGRFAEWLRLKKILPEHLLSGQLSDHLLGWRDESITIERVKALLDRGPVLALSMEKWLRSGLWVMTRSDADYPKRLKHHLRLDSPAVLFGYGNRALLDGGGLAVVGSRKAPEDDLTYSRKLGSLASHAGVSIISGGARGVDETAMLGALEAEGTAVGVLADSLLRAGSSAKYRRYLLENSLALVSPFNPEAGFNTGNAMQRNKYIYCLSDAALAVHSGKKGGTWTGGQEDLKKGWTPLWVKPSNDPATGNAALIKAGASEAPINIDDVAIATFFHSAAPRIDDPPSTVRPGISSDSAEKAPNNQAEPALKDRASEEQTPTATALEPGPQEIVDWPQLTLYEFFLAKAKNLCAQKPVATDELLDIFDVNKTQLNAWLKKAVSEGALKKLSRPVRYQAGGHEQESFALE